MKIEYPEAYLTLHGWKRERSDSWVHPKGEEEYTLKEAAEIQRLNDRVNLLVKEGWNVEYGGGDKEYYTHVGKMRSPAGFTWTGGRAYLSVSTAFQRQKEKGWTHETDRDPTLPAFRRGSEVRIWCVYCDQWHVHGCGDDRPRVGESNGHRTSHCGTHRVLSGYTLQIAYVDDRPRRRRA